MYSISNAYVDLLLCYTLTRIKNDDDQKLVDLMIQHLTKHDQGEVMHLVSSSYINQGMKKGLKQGLTEGKHQATVTIAKNLLSQNIKAEIISTATGLSIKELRVLSGVTAQGTTK